MANAKRRKLLQERKAGRKETVGNSVCAKRTSVEFHEAINPAKGISRDITQLFFDLANVEEITFTKPDLKLRIVQDTENELEHSGGIVWETSYLLASYLISELSKKIKTRRSADGKNLKKHLSVMDVGAGCGFLGIALAAFFGRKKMSVHLTEQGVALENLQRNVAANAVHATAGGAEDKAGERSNMHVARVDWTDESSYLCGDAKSFDIIAATDVLFCEELVQPLLRTFAAHCHDTTEIYLLVQVRSKEAHEKFFKEFREFFTRAEKIDLQVWGAENDSVKAPVLPPAAVGEIAKRMECFLWRLTGRKVDGGKRPLALVEEEVVVKKSKRTKKS